MADVPDLTRRDAICDAALELAADGGNRAVTHSGVDRLLELPTGSTSYYFRTRRALLDGAVRRLTDQSRAAFAALAPAYPAEAVGAYLHTLVTDRSRDVRARFALASDTSHDHELRNDLAHCLFSRDGATALFASLGSPTPAADAADLLVFCEGIAASHLFGATPTPAELTAAVRRRFGL
ncbi:TetR family transcriptional regulator [Gordonia sp. PDNC005]|uniref:TetR/AcrR family transcriptional regulator n=1 Tax=unclassified Gordonia (in: high G+C Gram-positive bacteria) TaxID=2657482 RepID=UPI0019635031|nr:TetR family transcriptional regulator [Gordonia sp. PDNC005]QRY63931.1 TetR family transcriptional regulator [Gordonia sp. PDNC005]